MELTDGQWLYLLANQEIDNEEHINGLCNSCKTEMEVDRCVQCGKILEESSSNNPGFDENKFKKLSEKSK